jgi:hypothetical protein
VDPRILIATLFLSLGIAAETPFPIPTRPASATDSVKESAGLPDTSSRRAESAPAPRDSAKVLREPALRDSTPAWSIPARDGSPGGALREAFRGGDPDASWSRVFEFDGMYESWTPWPSLPVSERAERLSWTGPSLAGVSDAAPSQVASVARSTEIGNGGERVRRLLALPSPQDTPSTSLQFFRGALASYRFGLDFSRAVAGPWGIALRMGTRSAQGRSWTYRDQIQDMFQGSFGRTREDLPGHGRSPGQDDVQWEAVVSRASAHLLFELGWTWVDLRRGIPDPRNAWGDSGYAAFPGGESRSGAFGRILSQAGEFKGALSGRWVGQDWARAGWFGADSGPPVSATGSTDHQELEGDVSWGGAVFRTGATGRAALRTGTSSTVSGTFQEDQERFGAYAVAALDSLRWRGDIGLDRLNDPSNRTLSGIDANLSMDWNGPNWHSSQRVAREILLPNWERSILPDPLAQSLPSRNLDAETRWFAESRQKWALGSCWSIDAAVAGVAIDAAIQPSTIPVEGLQTDSVRSGLVLRNASGRVLGWSVQGGARFDRKGWWIGSQGAVGRTLAPGEGIGGRRDLRYPVVNSRTTLGWRGPLLAGHAQAMSSMSLRTWSFSAQMNGTADGGAVAVRLPPGGQLDWENQLQIKTFALFWRLENLLDDRQVPAVGWTPPGIRSGWGVTWNFGG